MREDMPPPDKQYLVYRDPASTEDGERERRVLIEEIGSINLQLKDPEHAGDLAWRQRALAALRVRENILRRVNDWLASNRRRKPPIDHVLRRVQALLVRLDARGLLDEKDREDKAALDAELGVA